MASLGKGRLRGRTGIEFNLHILHHGRVTERLAAGIDQSVLALPLGHDRMGKTDRQRTLDLAVKERVLALTTPPATSLSATGHPTRFLPLEARYYAENVTGSFDPEQPAISLKRQ